MNKKRHPDYINLKHKIESCTKEKQLESLRQVAVKFAKENKGDDANDLTLLFLQKRDELNPNFYKN